MRSLTNVEKLQILLMDEKRFKYYLDVDLEIALSWVMYGHEWAFSWASSIFEREPHPLDEIVEETSDILKMFRAFYNSKKNWPDNQALLSFEGFDGNHDEHYSVANVIMKDLKRFSELGAECPNSHSGTSLIIYQKLLKKYNSVIMKRDERLRSEPLSTEELKIIMDI